MKNNSHNKNGYRLMVIDLDNSETVVNEEINCLLCGYATPTKDGGVASTLVLASCCDSALNATVKAAQKAIDTAREHLEKKKTASSDIRELLKEIIGELAKAAEE